MRRTLTLVATPDPDGVCDECGDDAVDGYPFCAECLELRWAGA